MACGGCSLVSVAKVSHFKCKVDICNNLPNGTEWQPSQARFNILYISVMPKAKAAVLLFFITALVQLLSRSKYYLWFHKSQCTDAVCLYSMYTEKFGSLTSENEKKNKKKRFGCLMRWLFLEIRVTKTIQAFGESVRVTPHQSYLPSVGPERWQ